MSRTLETAVIDGHTYEFSYLPPREATKIAVKLAKIIGPAAGNSVVKGISGKKLDDPINEALFLAGGLAELCERLDEKEVESLIDAALSCTTCTGIGEVNADGVHFQGKTLTMFKVAQKSLEHNFQDFFQGLGEIQKRVATLVEGLRHQTQTGTSGDPSSQDSQPSKK